MTTNSPNIDRLRIATPCPTSWDQMTGDNRVRFCDLCQLSVYNISELSKLEAQKLIASTEGRICARLFRRADGTILTTDCPVGLRALRMRVSKRVAAVFAAVIGITNIGFGQSPTAKDQKTSCTTQTKITRKSLTPEEATAISGSVLDIIGAVVPNAKILITRRGSNNTRATLTNDEGKFRFDNLDEGIYSLKIETPGFKHLLVKEIVLGRNQFINIDMTLELSGEVTIGIVAAETPLIDTTTSGVTVTISGDQIRRIPIQK